MIINRRTAELCAAAILILVVVASPASAQFGGPYRMLPHEPPQLYRVCDARRCFTTRDRVRVFRLRGMYRLPGARRR